LGGPRQEDTKTTQQLLSLLSVRDSQVVSVWRIPGQGEDRNSAWAFVPLIDCRFEYAERIPFGP